MNGKDIFLGLKYVGDDLIEKAEYGQFPTKAEHTATQKKRMSIRRPFLIAAIIAMMLLLVGCAVIYVLSLQDIKLGEQDVTYDVFDYDPKTGEVYEGQESVHQQVLTLAGLSNTPAAKAAREWYEFTETYDPDLEIQGSVWGNEPDFGDEYYGYIIYTQEMKEKLDSILDKYDLKLMGKRIEFPSEKMMFKALGIENVLNPGSEAVMNMLTTSYYEHGNFNLHFLLDIPAEENNTIQTQGWLHYRNKDCFIPDTAVLTEAEWEEWNYTTAAGDEVLIIRAEESASAWFFCDTGEYTTSLRLRIILDMYEETVDGVPVTRFELMTKEQLEQAADAIDFSLQPKLIDGWESLSDNAVPAGQEINGYTIEPVSAFTDGYAYQIILKITAPEGVALTDPEDHTVQIEPMDGSRGRCLEDGDGYLNTCHYILSDAMDMEMRPADGSYPYPQGNVIPVYWEDMYLTRFDFENSKTIYTLLTEGTWKFNIPLTEADTREIELLTEPITAEGCYGWSLDGYDATAEYKVSSIKLRSMGIDVTFDNTGKEGSPDFFGFNLQSSYVVMKDGTRMEFTWKNFDQPIDLDQVCYIQLADKTILTMPGVSQEEVESIHKTIPLAPQELPMIEFEDGVELLAEPIRLKSLAGYATDATGDMEPLYEYFNFTSVILHPQGLAMVGSHAFDFPEEQATVVMKDGSEIILTGMNGAPYCSVRMSQLKAESSIDISKVDHILLPDGTELSMP